jgi:hypothetical protein
LARAAQRSLLTVFIAPLFLLALAWLARDVVGRIESYLAAIQVGERFAAWERAVDWLWVAAAGCAFAARSLRSNSARRPWAVATLPVPRAVLELASATPWALLALALCAYASGIAAYATQATLGFFGPRAWLAALGLWLHSGSAVGVGCALALGAEALSVRLGRERLKPLIALAVLGLAWGQFGATSPWSGLAARLWTQLAAGGEAAPATLGLLAATALAAALTCTALITLFPRAEQQRRLRLTPLTTWRPSTNPTRAHFSLDCLLLRREPAGLLNAVLAQAVWTAVVLWLLNTEIALRAGDSARGQALAQLVLLMPACWALFGAIGPALRRRSDGQLASAPVALGERLLGRMSATVGFVTLNWMLSVAALAFALGDARAAADLGRGLALVAAGSAAAYYAGSVLPAELEKVLSGGGWLHTALLALVFVVAGVASIGWATSALPAGAARSMAQIALGVASIALWMRWCASTELRHGLVTR